MVLIMWCQIVKLFAAPSEMFVRSELELFQIDRLARSYSIHKLLRHRDMQRAFRKGSQLVLTLARAPQKIEKKRNNRD